jgi:rhodanese-related sulfurtransferase
MRPERVPPKQVLPLLDGPNPPFIVDLRPLRTIERSGFKLPGAVVGSPEEIDAQILALPKDTHLVFYCSCPNDAASATYALRFRKAGFQNAIAIQGGFDAWAEAGFPVEAAAPLGSGDAAVPAVGSTMENEA